MCGIAGVVDLLGNRTPESTLVEGMLDRLQHRGPDERGVWRGGPIVLGHTRLSIIDTQGSHQPLVSEQGVMSYNGEVFNYEKLRRDLPGPWASRGDTEVLERLVATRGPRGLREVRGQFAFARWEPADQVLTLGRDEMGVLPLFWWCDGEALVFASEIGALLAGLPHRPEIDRHGLSLYLGYRAVPAPGTLWQGVHKLLPGHTLRIKVGERVPTIEAWREEAPPAEPNMRFDEAVDRTRAALRESVALSIVADVPVGAYLSGGLDSSIITALAQRELGVPLHTYCASFGDASSDESEWAKLVASHVGTAHVDVRVPPRSFIAEWPALSRLRGAPVSEPSDVAVHHLALRASRDVKVVLSGEGSDELFAGYPKHRMAQVTRHIGLIPSRLRRGVLAGLSRRLPAQARRVAVGLRALSQADEDSRIRAWFASFDPEERHVLLGEFFEDAPLFSDITNDPLRRMLLHDQGAWLSDNLLERGDRMTMGASVELRPPFLDAGVVRTARQIPAKLHLHKGRPKAVVREVAGLLLPAQILDRPKAGFAVPVANWLRNDLRSDLQERLLPEGSFASRNLDRTIVHDLVRRHVTGRADESRALWTLLSLEIWAGEHV